MGDAQGRAGESIFPIVVECVDREVHETADQEACATYTKAP
jgi:hypothetical protein